MARHNRLPWDIFTKTVRKSPDEVYQSLLDRRLLSPSGQSDRAAVLRHIENIFLAMDSDGGDTDTSPYESAENALATSGYLNLPISGNGQLATSSAWPTGNLADFEIPEGYEIVKYYSPHVARARINRSGEEDGTIVEVLLKKSLDGAEHEFDILHYLQQCWRSCATVSGRPV